MKKSCLASYELIANSKVGFIACGRCGYHLSNWKNHLQTHKLLKNVTKEDEAEIMEIISKFAKGNEAFQKPKDPIQGLLVFEGWECQVCQKISTSKNGLRNHVSREHPGENPIFTGSVNYQCWTYETRFKV